MSTGNENILKLDSLLSMGYGIIPKKAMRDKRLTPEAKAIYAYLCSFAGSGNTAFPSVDLMCAEIGMSEDRFYRHRKLLVQCGYIAFKQIRGGRGKTGSNVYTILQSQEEIRDSQNAVPQNKGPQDRDPYNKGPQNKCTINNSPTNNSSKKNSPKKNKGKDGETPSLFPEQPEHIPGRGKREARPKSTKAVEDYIHEMGYDKPPYNLSAEEFLDKCEETGWKLKNGQDVKDWKARVRVFARYRKQWNEEKRASVPQSKQSVVIRDDDGQKWGLFDD